LLADVAVERLRPDAEPHDTGSGQGDLLAWAEQYAEEMASQPGRALIRDVLASDSENAGKCCGYTRQQLDVIAGRASQRGEGFPDVEAIIDRVVAPIMYRILFDDTPLEAAPVRSMVEELFATLRVPELQPA
jgi:hypothetical protein